MNENERCFGWAFACRLHIIAEINLKISASA